MGGVAVEDIKIKELKNKSLCPINAHPRSDGMCQKEKCAWYGVGFVGGCIIQLIAYRLSEIENRMPYGVKY